MSMVAVHLGCMALVVLDLLARAYRIQWLVHAQAHRISLITAIDANALGDAACAVTPLRLGGEAARIGGLLRRGVPVLASVTGIGIELLVAWPVTLLCGAIVVWRYAPAWHREAAPLLAASSHRAWPWIIGIGVACLAFWLVTRRWTPGWLRTTVAPGDVARLTPRLVLGGAICSFVNVVARVALLPLLCLSLDAPPAAGTMIVGSFGLLYSQLFLPIPSGLGAVDLGFLAGAAGSLGSDGAGLLLAWRLYTNRVGLVLGIVAAMRMFGWSGLRWWVRRLKTSSVSERDGAVTSASPP